MGLLWDLKEYLKYAEEEDNYNEILIDLCEFSVTDLVDVGEPLLEPLLERISEMVNIGYEWEDNHPDDVDWNWCLHAANILGYIGDKRAVKPLIKMLGLGASVSLDESIVVALANIGKPAVQPLITALGTKNSEFRLGKDVRTYAVKALIKIGEPSVKPLTKALERKNEDVRLSAKLALEKIK